MNLYVSSYKLFPIFISICLHAEGVLRSTEVENYQTVMMGFKPICQPARHPEYLKQ